MPEPLGGPAENDTRSQIPTLDAGGSIAVRTKTSKNVFFAKYGWSTHVQSLEWEKRVAVRDVFGEGEGAVSESVWFAATLG